MTASQFRRLALGLPEVAESAHQAHPDFRYRNKIFATLGYPDARWGMVKLTPAQQTEVLRAAPDAFRQAAGAWAGAGARSFFSRPSKRRFFVPFSSALTTTSRQRKRHGPQTVDRHPGFCQSADVSFMPKKSPEVDAYIAQAAPFARPILKYLRKVVHTGCLAVEEKIKWRFPHFEYKGNLAGMAAFKAHCSFGFWKGALIFGPEMAERDDAMGHFGRITRSSDLPNEKTLLSYVRKAVELNEVGIKVPRVAKPKGPRVLVIPEHLSAALRKNPKARKTFENFSYSNRKEYVEWIAEAKREETRRQRLETTVEWLAQGKSRMWRYQSKR